MTVLLFLQPLLTGCLVIMAYNLSLGLRPRHWLFIYKPVSNYNAHGPESGSMLPARKLLLYLIAQEVLLE